MHRNSGCGGHRTRYSATANPKSCVPLAPSKKLIQGTNAAGIYTTTKPSEPFPRSTHPAARTESDLPGKRARDHATPKHQKCCCCRPRRRRTSTRTRSCASCPIAGTSLQRKCLKRSLTADGLIFFNFQCASLSPRNKTSSMHSPLGPLPHNYLGPGRCIRSKQGMPNGTNPQGRRHSPSQCKDTHLRPSCKS